MVPMRVVLVSAVALLGAARRTDESLDLGRTIDGKQDSYAIERTLGKGGYGEVHLATAMKTDRQVVVKTIDVSTLESKESFNTELRVFSHMKNCRGFPHPNIIEYLEVFELSAREGVVVMEYATGGALSSLLYKGVTADSTRSGTRTDVGDELITNEAMAKELFVQVAAGAQWLAQCGVIHKDLKPDNIMLSKAWKDGGILKIIDFGLSSILKPGEVFGLDANMYYYLEQSVVPDRDPVRARTMDDFALGMLLAEVGTGVPAYFNPDVDEYSTRGNLDREKGLLYILADKRTCDKGDSGLWFPKRDFAKGGERNLHAAVKEVVGRSLYFIEKGSHFQYRSALDVKIGDPAFLSRSWLYNSKPAMSLLMRLWNWDPDSRVDPAELLKEPWFAGSVPAHGQDVSEEVAEPVAWPSSGQQAPHKRTFKERTEEPPPKKARVQDHETSQQVEQLSPVSDPVPQVQHCTGASKLRGPPSVCNLRFSGSSSCWVKISCNNGPAKYVELDSGFGGGTVDNCPYCKLVS
mmetsp:Transcript_38428/g.86617  ORF Transcript_38428/g.86617 Transcript_38428/m.86617 type:complete len:521 (-) Transcript_38428:74-1636(-)|eukprot:CAMPEP_0197931438 /NCGR_PEP_ID=MMETSP1439-20131203/107088_1 /TAXON_ID=66791 /ORGANISM="Gonyaulax spinifera, Strain CCMP409" /LENGTH=520 /DNA_ID=CAMNT_0043554175 /DNA_START=51 /DNA_END=1613 /DNA_ORIENTATION=-